MVNVTWLEAQREGVSKLFQPKKYFQQRYEWENVTYEALNGRMSEAAMNCFKDKKTGFIYYCVDLVFIN